MNNLPARISEVRRDLIASLADLYPGNEAVSVSRLILEHLGYPQTDMLKDPVALVDYEIQSEINKIVGELTNNRPVQYVLGETEFHELKFYVDENVLIPRPETEELVSNILLETKHPSPRVIDIGSGSGCIAISLAALLPGSRVTAFEKDPAALDIAKKNAEINEVVPEFIQGDILDEGSFQPEALFDVIVSNPPYVTHGEKSFMEKRVTDHEPDLALYVPDDDPLLYYRAIGRFAEKWLKQTGTIWVEINEQFGRETSQLFSDHGFINTRLMKDIHGKDRFIKAMRNNV